MKRKERVSIVMPTYNGEAYIREQIDSLLAQTYPAHEIVIQDDGSTDGTWAILEEYAARHPQIRLFRNEGVHGINPNLYSAIRRATGDLIAICDQDDVWEPQKTEEQVAMLGEALLIAGPTVPFSEDGSEVAFDRRTRNCHAMRLLFASAVPGHAMMLRPALLDCYEPNEVSCYDAQLQVAAASLERFCYQGVCPVRHRRHARALTYTKPTVGTRTATGALGYILTSACIYSKARPVMLRRMEAWGTLLDSIEGETESLRLAREMVRLMKQRGAWAKVRLAGFCYRHRLHLFHTVERDSLSLRIRALLFPLTAAYYYRTLI